MMMDVSSTPPDAHLPELMPFLCLGWIAAWLLPEKVQMAAVFPCLPSVLSLPICATRHSSCGKN